MYVGFEILDLEIISKSNWKEIIMASPKIFDH